MGWPLMGVASKRVAFDESSLIRRAAFDRSSLIRGVAISVCGLIRGVAISLWPYKRRTTVLQTDHILFELSKKTTDQS